jgi:hypothetical protein
MWNYWFSVTLYKSTHTNSFTAEYERLLFYPVDVYSNHKLEGKKSAVLIM